MLPPDSRVVRRELLAPPVGYRLSRAVGTTFTVDLASALSIPLSFVSHDLGDRPDPIGVMEAVRSSADRIDVFYQAGQARVPQQASDIFAFLEPVLHPVSAPIPGHLFHPKIWLLEFEDRDGVFAYRLVCSTRNLTDDRSWDAVVRLDGSPGSRIQAGNEPVARFIRALPELCAHTLSASRRDAIVALAESVRRVEWETPIDVNAIEFHALGLTSRNRTPDFSGYRRLVVSPFIDDDGLATVAPTAVGETVIVARPEHLDRLETVGDQHDLRAISVMAELQDDRSAGELIGLHAKLTVVERNRRGHVFIGSANATRAAYHGNVEFLVELVGGATKLGVDSHLNPELGFGAILEPYAQQAPVVDPAEELRFALQNTLRAVALTGWSVTVSPVADSYTLAFATDRAVPATEFRVTVEAMSRRGDALEAVSGGTEHGSLVGFTLADITPFLILTVSSGDLAESTVVPARLFGDPADRLDAVLARQVDTPEKFLRFLLLLLGLSADDAALAAINPEPSDAAWQMSPGGAAVFELLARALADNPASVDDVTRIVDRLSRTDAGLAVMPEGFLELWTAVTAARELIGTAS